MQATNELDFGQVIVHDQCVRIAHVINAGRVPLDFEWVLEDTDPVRLRSTSRRKGKHGDAPGHNAGAKAVTIRPARGTVAAGGREVIELAFAPTVAAQLKHLAAVCKIASGKSYTIQLAGRGHKPDLHLSWYAHDFGRIYTHTDGLEPLQKQLVIRNNDGQVRGVCCLLCAD